MRAPAARARIALLAGVLAAVVALPSLRNDFVEDDVWVVKNRPVLEAPPSLGAVLREPYWPRTFGGSLWRPAVLASWALDYRVSRRPAWFHAVNVVWAGLAAGLLALLAVRLAGPAIGLTCGLLFAVHPVHVEAASSVVGRAELMAAAGYACALLCALAVRRSAWWLVGVLAGAALAIGSKEHAATLPVVLLLVLAWKREPWKTWIAPVIAAAAPIVAYFVLRGAITGGALNPGGMAPGLEGLSFPERALAMLGVSLQWWRLLFFPLHLSSDWSQAQVAVIPSVSFDAVLAATMWIAAGIAAWRLRRTASGVWLGVAWFVITIGPVANVLVPTEVVLAERTLYLPSFGAMLAVSCVLIMARRGDLVRVAVAAAVVLLAARSIVRNEAWRDGDHLWAAVQRDAPRSYRTLWQQGDDAFASGRGGTGERLLREAMLAAPGIPGPDEDLAQRYAAAGLTAQALELLRHATTLNETRPRPWVLMEDVLLEAHRCDEAGRLLESKRQMFEPAEAERARAAASECRMR